MGRLLGIAAIAILLVVGVRRALHADRAADAGRVGRWTHVGPVRDRSLVAIRGRLRSRTNAGSTVSRRSCPVSSASTRTRSTRPRRRSWRRRSMPSPPTSRCSTTTRSWPASSRIVALVSADGRDAHTGLYPWGEGSYPLTSLPLRLWVFPDGVRIVDAMPPHEDLVGAEVASIGGVPIDEVIAALDPLIPRDNEATVTPVAATLPADPGDPPRSGRDRRPGRRRARARRCGRDPDDGADRAGPDGRLQRVGRSLRPAPAGRPARRLPVPSRGAAVVRGRRPRGGLRPVQPRRRPALRRPPGPPRPSRGAGRDDA